MESFDNSGPDGGGGENEPRRSGESIEELINDFQVQKERVLEDPDSLQYRALIDIQLNDIMARRVAARKKLAALVPEFTEIENTRARTIKEITDLTSYISGLDDLEKIVKEKHE